MIIIIVSTFVVALIVIKFIQGYFNSSKLPRGPVGLPVVGYAPFLGKAPYETFVQLTNKYGPVYSIKMGPQLVVVANGWEAVKDVLANPNLLGRPKGFFGGLTKTQNIGAGSGPQWKEQRRLSFRILHELGFGKQVMENNVKDELGYFLKEIEKNLNKVYDVETLLSSSTSNNVSYLLFGHRFDYDDPARKAINNAFGNVSRNFSFISQYNFFSHLLKIAVYFNLFGARKIQDAFDAIGEVVSKELREHEKTLDESNIRDYIDGYLVEMKKREATNDIGNFTVETMVENIRVFFGAGSNTVKDTLLWMLLFTANREDIQKKVQEEIDAVIGRERPVSWADRLSMPYTNAVICETERINSVTPINLPRRAMEDTKIGEHFIPKDTTVLANFWSVSRDPQLWKDPNSFDPTHFLSEDGRDLKKFDYHVPFSAGKRSCAGEMLARYQLFLYYASILQKFDIKQPDGVEPNFEGSYALALRPAQRGYYVFTARK